MKKIMILIAMSLSFSFAGADHHEDGDKMGIDVRKANITAKVDKKIAILNEFKSCVNASKDRAGIKNCRQI